MYKLITSHEGYRVIPLSHPVFDVEDITIVIEEYIQEHSVSQKDMVSLMRKFIKYAMLMQGEEYSTILTGNELIRTFEN